MNFVVFGGLVSAALVLRRRTDYHKRLMLLATFSLAIAGIGRLPFGHSGSFFGLLGLDLLLPYAFIAWTPSATIGFIRPSPGGSRGPGYSANHSLTRLLPPLHGGARQAGF